GTWCLIQACCTLVSVLPEARPSMVVMRLPTAALTGITHERVAAPLMWTVQAPHCAMPQPYLVPVRPTCSRSTHSNGVLGSTLTSCVFPLIVKRTMPASSQWIRYAVSYSNSAGRATAIAVRKVLLSDYHQQRDEDQADGIKPIVVCSHAGIVAPAPYRLISAGGRFVADEIDEAGQILPELGARRLVGELAGGIENITCPRNLQPAAEPGARAERAQHRQPGVLRQDGAETARRSADHPDRATAEDLGDVGRGPGKPVDGVLERAGNRVVVLRGHQQQPFSLHDPVFQGLHRRRDALGGFEITVVQRDAL